MVKNNITHNAAQQSESLDSVLLRFQNNVIIYVCIYIYIY